MPPNTVALILVLLLPPLLVGAAAWDSLSRPVRTVWVAVAALVALTGAAACVAAVRAVIASPPEWDMQSFWVYGRAIVSGRNFYLPSAFTDIGRSMPFSPGFIREEIQTGFVYPPQSALLFAPLGLLDLHTATVLWMALHAALLLVAGVLLWRTFFPERRRRDLLLVFALLLTLHATIETLQLGQTNFLVLVLLLVFWHRRDDWTGGFWLALGMCVKPLFACFALYLFARRAWRSLGVAAAVMAVITLITVAVFGMDVMLTYLRANPSRVVPPWFYTERVNQSLLATLLRAGLVGPVGRRALIHPLFVLLGGFIVVVSAWVAAKVKAEHSALGLATVVAAGLLLYPATLDHYSVHLVALVLLLWTMRRDVGWSPWLAASLGTAVLALTWVRDGRVTVAATALAWGLLVAGSVRATRRVPAPAGSREAVAA